MVHPYWLLFSFVWLLNTVTDANNRVLITAKITHNSFLGKCQSCLTDIAGMDRLSFASLPEDKPNEPSPTARFQASCSDYSLIRANLDCQTYLTCGFITIQVLEHAQNTNRRATLVAASETLCILTDVQTSFDCGICLKMMSSSRTIQKFQLIIGDKSEQYLHVLYTSQRSIFEPCSSSGICSGFQYEFDNGDCKNFARKLSWDEFTRSRSGIPVRIDNSAGPLKAAMKSIYETRIQSAECFVTSASHESRKDCLECMAKQSLGIAVLVNDIGTSVGPDKIKSKQHVWSISKKSSNFDACVGQCTSITPVEKQFCLEATSQSIDSSQPSGKIYYNTAEYRQLDEIIQDPLALSQSSSCLRVEHKLDNDETCQRCMEKITGSSVKRLSGIDFLIESIRNLYEISKCISSSNTPDLCKKVVNIPDRFCRSFNTASPGQASRISTIRRGWPLKPTLECFTCLTSMLDILIIDLVSFWMVGSPSDSDCIVECKDLKMDEWEMWDVSSIRPMSANSIKERFGIVEEQ